MSPPATKTPKAAPAKKPAAAPAKKPAAAAKKPAPRADYGAPIDGFFARQPPALRPILEALRSLVEETVPRVEASLKWGMPFFSLNGVMMCAIGGHKAHVNLMLAGVPGVFTDPKNLLVGEGKTGRHLKLTKLEELPRDDVRRWLREAAAHARKNG